jgi:hypothetical protein
MKKSNKLLIAGLLTIVLFIVAFHVVLYANYKNNKFTVSTRKESHLSTSMESFPGIRTIIIDNLPDATIQFGDVAQVEKDSYKRFQYVRAGDTLKISRHFDYENGGSRNTVLLTIPYNAKLLASSSSIFFYHASNNNEINSEFHLQRSTAIFNANKEPVQFDHLKIFASDSSLVTFQGNIDVRNLEVDLLKSSIEYKEGNFGQLSITADSISGISLQARHLLKAKITIIGSN